MYPELREVGVLQSFVMTIYLRQDRPTAHQSLSDPTFRMLVRDCGVRMLLHAAWATAILGKVFPPTNTDNIPEPLAFFPLTEGTGDHINSYPDTSYLGTLNGSIPYVPFSFYSVVRQQHRRSQLPGLLLIF
jgi:hypothetical protein